MTLKQPKDKGRSGRKKQQKKARFERQNDDDSEQEELSEDEVRSFYFHDDGT
jgi:hypothetical protein